LDNDVAPSAESMFVRTENSEIQRTDGNQALNLNFAGPKCLYTYISTLQTETSLGACRKWYTATFYMSQTTR